MPRIDALEIDDHILDKIESKHGVTFEEVEDVCLSPASHQRRVRSRVILVLGQTRHGRYLAAIVAWRYPAYFVVSAREMELHERRLHARQTKTRRGR